MTTDDITKLITKLAHAGGLSQEDINSMLYIVDTIAAAEREACAKVCDDIARLYQRAGETVATECAETIRARSKT